MPPLDDLRAAAAARAAALEADFTGTEHLLLAWLDTATGPLADAVTTAGLTPDTLAALMAQGKGRRRGGVPAGEPGGLSSQAQRVIDLATEQAVAAGRTDATPDDLFLAMIHEPRGIVARALTEYQLKPSKLRALVRAEAPKPRRDPAEAEARAAEKAARRAARENEPKPERPARSEAPAPKSERPARPEPKRGRDPEIDDIPEPRAPVRPKLVPPPKPVAVVVEPAKRRFGITTPLFLAVPVAIWLYSTGADPLWIFITACLGVLPLAGLMGTATEHLAEKTGPALGGLLNATFGNAAELIIALAALRAGYVDLVKASITGSILGNLLLILGLSLIAGGTRKPMLAFNRTNAGMSSAMLALAVAGMVFPALFHATHPDAAVLVELHLSEAVAVILGVTYILSLVFVLRTHRPLFGGASHGVDGPVWGIGRAVLVLGLATVGVAVMSEILVHAVEPVTKTLGVSEVFLGLIIIPVIGNAAEHATAIVVARKGNTDLAFQIALGSCTQVALLVAPILVFAGAMMGVVGMNLVFPAFEVMALSVSVILTAIITLDGESHWFEGVQLLALYAMLGAAAWFI
ncbi:MAG: calcium/proton exchanger [Gemmatimonadales bacterium]|nr:calcium/proton exchanger [Gemmatimonadales bacterium]